MVAAKLVYSPAPGVYRALSVRQVVSLVLGPTTPRAAVGAAFDPDSNVDFDPVAGLIAFGAVHGRFLRESE
jgi:hypothetical protein